MVVPTNTVPSEASVIVRAPLTFSAHVATEKPGGSLSFAGCGLAPSGGSGAPRPSVPCATFGGAPYAWANRPWVPWIAIASTTIAPSVRTHAFPRNIVFPSIRVVTFSFPSISAPPLS